MKRLSVFVGMAVIAAAGFAAAAMIVPPAASAWNWTGLPTGYNVFDSSYTTTDGGTCHRITVNGTYIGDNCDAANFQHALDAYINSTICSVNPAAGGSLCVTTTTITTQATTAETTTAADTTTAQAPEPPTTTESSGGATTSAETTASTETVTTTVTVTASDPRVDTLTSQVQTLQAQVIALQAEFAALRSVLEQWPGADPGIVAALRSIKTN